MQQMHQDSIYTYYRRGLNTDLWQANLNIQKWISSKTQLRLSEAASSSRLLAAPVDQQWKDQHLLVTDLLQHVSPSLALNFWGSSYLYADKQTGFQEGNIRTHNFDVGLLFQNDYVYLPARIGYKEDQRFGQKDSGLHYKIGLIAQNLTWGEYDHYWLSNYEEDNLDQRKNNDMNLSYLVHREFYTDTYDSLHFVLNHQRRDYYISNSGTIESRVEKTKGFDNALTYRISNHWKLRLNTSLFSRSLNITNVVDDSEVPIRDRNDFQTNASVFLGFRMRSLWTHVKLGYRGEEQVYDLGEEASSLSSIGSTLATPDNRSGYNTLTWNSGVNFSKTDSLVWNSSIQRFRYDTPDENNYDDRDELRIRSQLQMVHQFSPTLEAQLTFGLNLLHIVYIFGEKSANNNWTRVIRLNPSIYWEPVPGVQWRHGIEVMANYVDYDYEDLLAGTRSFLYRKLRMQDSTRFEINPRLSCQISYQMELDETGKLLWGDWEEKKLIDRQSHSLSVSLQHKPWREVFVTPGYSLYTRRGYRNNQNAIGVIEREKTIDFTSHGPILTLGYQGKRMVLFVRGSSLIILNKPSAEQILNRLELNMSWKL